MLRRGSLVLSSRPLDEVDAPLPLARVQHVVCAGASPPKSKSRDLAVCAANFRPRLKQCQDRSGPSAYRVNKTLCSPEIRNSERSLPVSQIHLPRRAYLALLICATFLSCSRCHLPCLTQFIGPCQMLRGHRKLYALSAGVALFELRSALQQLTDNSGQKSTGMQAQVYH